MCDTSCGRGRTSTSSLRISHNYASRACERGMLFDILRLDGLDISCGGDNIASCCDNIRPRRIIICHLYAMIWHTALIIMPFACDDRALDFNILYILQQIIRFNMKATISSRHISIVSGFPCICSHLLVKPHMRTRMRHTTHVHDAHALTKP